MAEVNSGTTGTDRTAQPRTGLPQLRREYEADGIGPELYALLNRVVIRTTRHYPAIVYSPDGEDRWTPEGRAAVAHGWAADRLLSSRRSLERALDRAATIEQLERILRLSLRDHLRDALAPDGSRRMRRRCLAALASLDGVTCIAGNPRTDAAMWTLEERAGALTSRRRLEHVAWDVPDSTLDLVREVHCELRLPPIIRTSGLERLLTTLLLSGPAQAGDLVAAVCSRLMLPDPTRLPSRLDDPLAAIPVAALADELADPLRGADDWAIAADADAIADALSDSDLVRLAAYAACGEHEVRAAAQLGCNRRTIRRSREALRDRIVEMAPDGDHAIALYDRVIGVIAGRCHS